MKRRVEKIEMDCPECGGRGWKPAEDCEVSPLQVDDCSECLGSGRVLDFPPEPEFDKYEKD
jgi:DnaJ-class molecular chaperone